MVGQWQSGLAKQLDPRWRRWRGIVRLYAVRHEKRHYVDPREYQQLHAELIQLCRQKPRAGNTAECEFLQRLEEILSPWVTLDSLGWADREIVCKLLQRCDQVQRVLDGRPTDGRKWKWAGYLLLGAGLLIAMLVVPAMLWHGHPVSWPWLLAARRWFRRVRVLVIGSSIEQRLLIGGGLVTLMVIAVVCLSVKRR